MGGGGACSSSLTRNSSPGSTSGSSMGAIPKQYVNTYAVNPPAACPKSPAAPDSLMGRLSPMVTGNHHPSRLHRLQMLQAKKQPKGGLRYTGAAAAADMGYHSMPPPRGGGGGGDSETTSLSSLAEMRRTPVMMEDPQGIWDVRATKTPIRQANYYRFLSFLTTKLEMVHLF